MQGRFKLLLIGVICAAPTIAAYLVYHFWPPQSRSNYGELIDVRPLPSGFFDASSSANSPQGKWVMLAVDSGECDAHCRDKLYAMRQVRLTQGREMSRVARVWLIDDEQQPDAKLIAEYEGMALIHASRSSLQALPAEQSRRDHIYVVDPLGNLMMRFPKNADPSKVARDMSRLLKVSRIG